MEGKSKKITSEFKWLLLLWSICSGDEAVAKGAFVVVTGWVCVIIGMLECMWFAGKRWSEGVKGGGVGEAIFVMVCVWCVLNGVAKYVGWGWARAKRMEHNYPLYIK